MNILFFVSQILPGILSRTCEPPLCVSVCVCVYLQKAQQILIKKLWKQQKSQKITHTQTLTVWKAKPEKKMFVMTAGQEWSTEHATVNERRDRGHSCARVELE